MEETAADEGFTPVRPVQDIFGRYAECQAKLTKRLSIKAAQWLPALGIGGRAAKQVGLSEQVGRYLFDGVDDIHASGTEGILGECEHPT